MSKWKEYIFSDFVLVNPTVSLKKDEAISFVEMKDLEDGKRYCEPSQERMPSGGSRFQERDTLFARITPCLENGKICQVKNLKNGIGLGSTEFHVFRGKDKVSDTDFVYYLSRWTDVRDHAEINLDGTSGRQRVPKQAFDDLILTLPSLPEQKAIASILSSLDDKIDLLHRQNATLEKMAETLFRQWFVEEAKDEWKVEKLADEFDFTMGASPPGESYNEDGTGIPMYQGNADFGFRFPSNRVFTTDPKRFAKKNDTLISVRAPVGEQNMANEKCCIGRGVAAFSYKKDNSFYSYTYYKIKSLMDDIKQFNETGTIFGSISKSDLEGLDIVRPDEETILRFQNLAKPIDDKIELNETQIRTLTTLRNTLLPKLMSGEISVKTKG
ncbi:restriction endonuclease subunit S [Terrimonas ferruginea]|uniref:restriction endonuclease subunit S n=1 Tax=Terrimonas ferruginea TaxID=249 RepID=UPI000423C611|nr:restriction endonuclease subunit S [Terrimonas ferruginea]